MTSDKHLNNSKVDLTWLEQYHKIMVVGLGVSGVGVVKTLTSKGFIVDIQDSREQPAGLAEVKNLKGVRSIHLGNFDQKGLLASDILVLSPGVSLQTPELKLACQAGVKISGDIDIVARSTNIPIIAISGSNGKSTVTQLAGEMCQLAGYKTFIGGNIGLSAMDILSDDADYDIAILELSSFQLETTPELAAHSAVVLNLSPDHLDRYAGFQEYAQTKLAIYNQAKHIVWNRDDAWLKNVELLRKNDRTITSFGLDEPVRDIDFGIYQDEQGENWLVKGNNKLLSVRASQLLGEHNQANFLAVLALLDSFGISLEIAEQAITNFSGLSHRMQFVREKNGVTWINDSKATNIGATAAAIEGLKGDIVLIAGGQAKGADFTQLLPILIQYVRHVYLIGEDAGDIYAAWNQHVDCHIKTSLKEAIVSANSIAQKGQYVLFAPACASFDMFQSYVERGDQFMQWVNAL